MNTTQVVVVLVALAVGGLFWYVKTHKAQVAVDIAELKAEWAKVKAEWAKVKAKV